MVARHALVSACFLTLWALPLTASAADQSPAKTDGEQKGITLYESFQGSSNTLGQVYKLDTTVGYNFNKYFGIDVGIPYYFVQASSSSTSGFTSGNGIGNVYADLNLTVDNPLVNFASTLEGTAPTGDAKRGFSTGRATFDWSNHFDRTLLGITPFANLGVANTVSDTRFFVRPFTTLGTVVHFEGGASYRFLHLFSAGASLYDVLPSGQQKVFSKLIGRQSSASGGMAAKARRHGGVFENSSETVGGADIARDNGFSAWLDASPAPFLDLEGGYSRSVHYDLDSLSFNVGVNVGYFIRKAKHR